MYYHATAESIAVSPSILLLLREGAPRDLDEDALAAFLRLGYFVGEDTPFRSIRALPPNARLEWAAGRLDVAGELPVVRAQSVGRREALDAYVTVFRAAIRRRVDASGPIILPLSGGRDSRHILMELCGVGRPPALCVTATSYPTLPTDDVPIAARLAARAGVPHLTLKGSGSRIRSELRKNRVTGFCTDEHTWYLLMADYLNGRADTVYDGIGGGVLSGGAFLSESGLGLLEGDRLEEFVRRYLFWTSETGLAGLLAPRQYERFSLERASARVVAECRKHVAFPNPLGSFYFWNRTRREIALVPYGTLNRVPRVFAPFLDHDVFDVVSSFPATMFLDHGFHAETIRRAFPEFGDIGFAGPADPPTCARNYFRCLGGELAWYTGVHCRLRMIRKSFAMPRLMRCAIDGRNELLEWWRPLSVLHLMGLERISREGAAVI